MAFNATMGLTSSEIAIITCSGILTLVAVVVNMITIIYYSSKHLLRYVHSFLIFNLAVCDILLAICLFSLHLHVATLRDDSRCMPVVSSLSAMQLEQSLLLFLIIWDRIVLVKQGNSYHKILAIPWIKLKVFITWCISIGLGIVDALLVKTGSRLSNEYCLYPKSLVDFVHIIIVFILLSCLGLSIHLGMRIKKLRTSSLSEPSGSRKGSLPIKAREDINWNDYLLNEPKKPKSPKLQEQQVVLGNQPGVAGVQLGTPSPTSQRLSGGLREGTVAPLRSTIPEDEPSGEVDDAEHTKTDNSLPYTKKAQSVKKGKVAPLKGDLETPLSSAASMEGVDKKKIRSIFPVRFRVGQSSDEGTIQGIPRGRWPTRPEQSLLPTILRWLTSSGQREVYGVLEITLLILVQMIFVMPQSLNAVFFSVGIDQDPRIHFYLQWLVFGPVIITACLYAPTTLCDSCCSHEEPGNKPEKSISSI